jgi:hypothetical protein
VLVTGLLIDSAMQVDLEEAAVQHKLQQRAWGNFMEAVEGMRAEGRHEVRTLYSGALSKPVRTAR